MTSCAPFRPGAPEGAVHIIAHRGASAYAPENTLAAYRLAAEMKADWFETDVRLSRDGEVFILHDAKLDRTTSGQGSAAEMTLRELREVDAGGWMSDEFSGQKIPTLVEAFELAREEKIGIYVEIKRCQDDAALEERILRTTDWQPLLTPADRQNLANTIMHEIKADGTINLTLTRETIGLIRDDAMTEWVVIQSFSPVICAAARFEAPEMRVELLGSDKPDDPGRWRQYLRWVELLDVHGCNLSTESVRPEYVERFHNEGRSVAAWTVDDPEEIGRMIELGVDRIISNRPDVARQVARELGRR